MRAPEGFDRGDDAAEAPDESLEGARKEFLEKYGDEEVNVERQESGQPESESRIEGDREVVDGAETRLEEYRELILAKYGWEEPTARVEDGLQESADNQEGPAKDGTAAAEVRPSASTGERSDSKIEASDEARQAGPAQEAPIASAAARDADVEVEDEKPESVIVGYERQVAVTEHGAVAEKQDAGQEELETDDFRRFPEAPEQETVDARTLEAVDYGRGAVLRVPKTDLEREGFDPDEARDRPIVELQVKDCQSEDEEVRTVFARYSQADRRAEAYVGGIGGEKGDAYEPVRAREYTEDAFVRDFERCRCEHFRNIRAEHEEERMFVVVDDRKVELEDWRLSTSGHQVVLGGRLGGEADFRVEFDGRREAVKFGRGYPVDEMKMEGDELVVSYSQSRNDRHDHRMHLEHLEAPERPSLNQFDGQEMYEHVKMFDHPERIEGVYRFVLDRDAQWETRSLLDEAMKRNDNQYGVMKAEISERLVPNLMELVGWERVAWHPFSDNTKEGASANGTDWLMRTPDGKLVLMEVKWWTDKEKAECKGESQIVKDWDSHRKYKCERILGAYLATTDWEVSDSPMKVYLKMILPEASLN